MRETGREAWEDQEFVTAVKAAGRKKLIMTALWMEACLISYGRETQISRKDFGMTFNAMLDGKWIVSDEVQILVEGGLIKQKQA